MTTTWADAERFLLAEAERDLAEGAHLDGRQPAADMARPCLLAFRREEPIAVAFLRDFAKGEYHDAIIEVLALVGPLRADRLALSVSGRATSWEDPIPPVLPGVGDLRQRVLVLHFADREADPMLRSTVHPFDVVHGTVRWGEAMRDASGNVEGWIAGVLRCFVGEGYGKLRAPRREIRKQLNRCSALGHLVGVGPAVAQWLGLVDA